MAGRMIYEALEQLLREVFVDVEERNVAFSLGDLFGMQGACLGMEAVGY